MDTKLETLTLKEEGAFRVRFEVCTAVSVKNIALQGMASFNGV
jgi:hypothetical protein